MSTVAKTARFIWGYLRMNIASAMEYRTNFITQVAAMFANDVVLIFFWRLFFLRFPVVNGWAFQDVVILWAIFAGGYGITYVIFGNVARLAGIIVRGELDHYLLLPKNVLLHVLVSRSSMSAWGDLLFGLVIFWFAGPVSALKLLAFLYGILLTVLTLTGFGIIAGSLAFFLGNAEGLSRQLMVAFITLATYPITIFKGVAKFILLTVIPAGVISSMPLRLIRTIDPVFVVAATLFAIGLLVAGTWIFKRGMRRYESGNLMTIQM